MPTPVLNYNIGVSLDWLSPKIKLIISENQIPKDQISKRSIFYFIFGDNQSRETPISQFKSGVGITTIY